MYLCGCSAKSRRNVRLKPVPGCSLHCFQGLADFRGQAVLLLCIISCVDRYLLGIQRNGVGGAKMKGSVLNSSPELLGSGTKPQIQIWSSRGVMNIPIVVISFISYNQCLDTWYVISICTPVLLQ